MYKLLSKKLLGEGYRNAYTGLVIAVVLGAALSGLGSKLKLAQSVLVLTVVMFSGAIIFGVLSSKDNARCLKGLFAMPCDEKRTLWEYAAAVGLYTLLTKTSLLAGLMYALVEIEPMQIVFFLLSFLLALFGSMTAFGCMKKAPLLGVLIMAAAFPVAFFLPKGVVGAVILAVLDVIFAAALAFIPLSCFRVSDNAKLKVRRSHSNPKFVVLTYIVRYLLENKNYIVGSVGILAFSCFFAHNAETMGLRMGCGLGMALISASTPMAIIVSSNRGLKQKLDMLPDKTRSFFLPYSAVVFCFFMICYAIFLAVCAVIGVPIDIRAFITAPLFAAQSALFASLMENKFTITKWSTEQDLWHNPRKYILPVLLTAETALIYIKDLV